MLVTLAGALLPMGTLVVGYVVGKNRKTENSEPFRAKDPKPICQCTHGWSLHGEDGACGSVSTERVLVERGSPRSVESGLYGDSRKVVYDVEKWQTVTTACACKRYTGPEPMPTMVAL